MSICAFFFFIARTFKIPFKKKNILNILWSLLFNLRRSISLHQSHRNPRGKSDPLISSQIVWLKALYVTGNAPEVDGENLTWYCYRYNHNKIICLESLYLPTTRSNVVWALVALTLNIIHWVDTLHRDPQLLSTRWRPIEFCDGHNSILSWVSLGRI